MLACSESSLEPLSATKKTLPEADSAGARLLKEKCSACHGAPQPDVHVARLWPSVLHRMQNRMTMKAYYPLTKSELATLLSYLQKHSKPDQK